MKYLVTGGAGFIGSHLVDRLLKDGHEVVVIDDLSTGKLENLAEHPRLKVHQVSILDDIRDLFKYVDVVFHLAALTRPRESIKNPEKTYDVNVWGTIKVLNFCEKNEIERIVFVSSATTYGFQDKFPTNEKAIQHPVSPYAESKYFGEDLCKFYKKMWGMKINIVRPFNVYGTRQDPSGPYGAAVPKFIDSLKNGKEPFITGDGEQFRDFIYIDDLVELLISASGVLEFQVHGKTFNGGSGNSTTINDLYKLISKIMDKKVKPRHVKEIKEPMTRADIGKAKRLLGWKPKVSLKKGLKRMIYG